MSYNVEDMLTLLISIKNTSSSAFLAEHLSYEKVGFLCSEAIKAGFIIDNHKMYQITEVGENYIVSTNNLLRRKGIDRAIFKIPDAITEKMGIEDIYLPDNF